MPTGHRAGMGMDGRGEGKVRCMHQTAKGHLHGQNLSGLQAESSREACEVQGFRSRQKEAILLTTIFLLTV